MPRHPDDFWGEHSHALHDVLQAPALPVDRLGDEGLVERAGEGRAGATRSRQRASGSWPARVRAAQQVGRAQWVRLVRLVRRVRLVRPGRLVSWPDWRGRRLPFAVAGTAVVVLLLALWTETMSSSPSPTTGQPSRPGPLLAGIGSRAALGPDLGRTVHGAANAVSSHRGSAVHRTRPIRRRTQRHRPAAGHRRNPRPSNRHAAPAQASSPTPVTYPAPQTPSPSGGSSSVSGGGVSAPRNEPTATAVNASASHSSPASPTGAAGALGPVKSPNG